MGLRIHSFQRLTSHLIAFHYPRHKNLIHISILLPQGLSHFKVTGWLSKVQRSPLAFLFYFFLQNSFPWMAIPMWKWPKRKQWIYLRWWCYRPICGWLQKWQRSTCGEIFGVKTARCINCLADCQRHGRQNFHFDCTVNFYSLYCLVLLAFCVSSKNRFWVETISGKHLRSQISTNFRPTSSVTVSNKANTNSPTPIRWGL